MQRAAIKRKKNRPVLRKAAVHRVAVMAADIQHHIMDMAVIGAIITALPITAQNAADTNRA